LQRSETMPIDQRDSLTSDNSIVACDVPSSPPDHRRHALLVAVVLLLLVTGLCLFALNRNSANPPREALRVPELGPKERFQQQCSQIRSLNGETLQVMEFEVDDAMLRELSALTSLTTVLLDQGTVTDDSVGNLISLPHLTHLRLRFSPIGDRGLAEIAQLRSLQVLNLPHAECSAEGVAQLQSLPDLRQLRLGSTRLGNEVCEVIARMPSLRGVHLIGVPVTDEGLKLLASVQQLQSLYLDDSAVTEEGWEWLFQNYPRLHVHVNQSHHDRDPNAQHEH
jgi:hypothetical protein